MPNLINKPDEPVEGQILRRAFDSTIKSIDADKRQIEFIISTATADRYGDTIQVNGWDLKHYKKNPVVLFAHNSSIPPVGKSIKTWKDGEALRAIAEFMPADMSAFADSIFRMYQEQFLRATSVGFRPLQYEPIMDEDGNPTWAYNFLKQELLEFSCVPVPANPEALISARHKGIDTTPIKQWAEEMLDDWKVHEKEIGNTYRISRKEMEMVRRRAAGAGATFVVPQEMQDQLLQRNLERIRKYKEQKSKVGSFETVTIRGVDYELPLRKEVGEIGEIVLQKDYDGVKNPVSIKKAGDTVLFSQELVEAAKDAISPELRQDGSSQELFIDVKGGQRLASYEILGVTEAGDLYGVKVKDVTVAEDGTETPTDEELAQAIQDAEVVDLTGEDDEAKAGDTEEEKDSVNGDDDTGGDGEAGSAKDANAEAAAEDNADEPEGEDEDVGDDTDDAGDDDTDDDDDNVDTGKSAKKVETVELTFSDGLRLVEDILCDFEGSLGELKAASAHDVRKAKFLAGFMRELADRLDGGKKGADAEASTAKKVEEEEQKTFTPAQAKDYINNLAGQLKPVLDEIVSKKLAQQRGRLD